MQNVGETKGIESVLERRVALRRHIVYGSEERGARNLGHGLEYRHEKSSNRRVPSQSRTSQCAGRRKRRGAAASVDFSLDGFESKRSGPMERGARKAGRVDLLLARASRQHDAGSRLDRYTRIFNNKLVVSLLAVCQSTKKINYYLILLWGFFQVMKIR